MLQRAGIDVECDLQWGVMERRRKDESEIAMIHEAQRITEEVMELACSTVARATADASGMLHHDGAPLTSERMRTLIDVWLLERECSNPGAIVAGGPVGADCHDHGHGRRGDHGLGAGRAIGRQGQEDHRQHQQGAGRHRGLGHRARGKSLA